MVDTRTGDFLTRIDPLGRVTELSLRASATGDPGAARLLRGQAADAIMAGAAGLTCLGPGEVALARFLAATQRYLGGDVPRAVADCRTIAPGTLPRRIRPIYRRFLRDLAGAM